MKSGLRSYHVTITGTTPLLMHADDIEWADQMEAWKNDKDNKKNSRAGDDRSPAHRWIGNLYHNERDEIIIPAENIMRALMEGGTGVFVPGGRSGKTFKAQTQSGIMPRDVGWPVSTAAKVVSFVPIRAMLSEGDFAAHKQVALACGFSLFVKRAKIGKSKHVRVRPKFDEWSVAGELVVTDDQITTPILNDIIEFAGKYKGLGDWRPSSPTPGTFGMFTALVKEA